MYITTSRKPSQLTRKLAKLIAVFTNSVYENRGKKSIEDLVERAIKIGAARIAIVEEYHGNPSQLSFIKLNKEWDWIGFLKFSLREEDVLSINEAKKIKYNLEKNIKDIKTNDKTIKYLFDFEEPITDDYATVFLKKNKKNRKELIMKYKENSITFLIKDIVVESKKSERE